MINKPLYGNSFGNLLQAPQRPENIDKQYFYNKDLNKLFNMSGGTGMAAPKGFENVNKNQYEDFASKGATLQGASMFTNSMGGGYNLDLPRLTSGPNSGAVDRNSPEYLYYHGDDQKTKLGSGYLESLTRMPSQEEGLLGPGLVGGQGPLPDLGIKDSRFIGINPDSITSEAGPLASSTPGVNPYALNNSNFSFNTSNPLNQLNVTPPEIPLSMQQPIPGLGAPPQGIGSLTPTPQQPGIGGLLGSGNAQPPQGINEPGFNDQLTGIKSLSEFGNPPSLGGNSFGNPLIGNTLGWNNSFQPTQQGFNNNNNNNYNQELNSYVDNTINGRLKNIFSGIMGLLT